ncbi:MAG: hypothetical protein ACI4NG_04480 [Candidatus Gallimonas sp.]
MERYPVMQSAEFATLSESITYLHDGLPMKKRARLGRDGRF